MQADLAVDNTVVPDWATGFDVTVPCLWKGCDREVSWYGNQHGCRFGHCCEAHRREYMDDLLDDMREYGYLICASCRGKFFAIPHYVMLVRA